MSNISYSLASTIGYVCIQYLLTIPQCKARIPLCLTKRALLDPMSSRYPLIMLRYSFPSPVTLWCIVEFSGIDCIIMYKRPLCFVSGRAGSTGRTRLLSLFHVAVSSASTRGNVELYFDVVHVEILFRTEQFKYPSLQPRRHMIDGPCLTRLSGLKISRSHEGDGAKTEKKFAAMSPIRFSDLHKRVRGTRSRICSALRVPLTRACVCLFCKYP